MLCTTWNFFIEILPVAVVLVVFWLIRDLLKKMPNHLLDRFLETLKADLQIKTETIKADILKVNEEYLKRNQKYLDVVFRDENVRTQIVPQNIIKADNERIRIYKNIYNLFFKILYLRNTIICEKDPVKQEKMMLDLHNEIKDIRTDIFTNSFYLDTLIDYLLPAQIGLWSDLESIQAQIKNQPYIRPTGCLDSQDELWKAEKWILENMKPYLTLKNIDLPDDINAKLHEQRTEITKQELEKTINTAANCDGEEE
ncbi:MAG: hypothetical protein FWB85_10280 [Chitinispirillia bacterium]|nr:hypothetical protein [Chitinispirillia bacterium]